MKTLSIFISSICVSGFNPIYSNAFSIDSFSSISIESWGLGILPVIGDTIPGLVPQVTKGSKLSLFIMTCLS